MTVFMTLLVAVIFMGVSLPWFAWTIVVPIAQAWWIHRVRTVADTDGLTAVRMFGSTRLHWDEIDGLAFPKWRSVCAVRADGSKVRLPAVTFRELPRLSAASGGRVPDPYAAAREARLAARG
ncbi:MAG: PH domain-containing protein [Gordonia sp.]|nr:PH domain-containing protein [Gordonia sp. (in: high G+C Gram-positive bacteria)]